MKDYKNISSFPQDLPGGRILGRGEVIGLSVKDESDEFVKRLIAEGVLAEVPKAKTKQGGEKE